MTLIVSLRTVDGIVIAGDSLSTVMAQVQFKAEIDVKCPSCGHEHRIDPIAGGGQIPSATFSFAQKVFPFLKRYGVGTYGSGQIADKTMYFAARELEASLIEANFQPSGVTEVATKIGEHIHALARSTIKNLDQLPDDSVVVGFQIVGYDGSEAKTIEVGIGKDIKTKPISSKGCTVSGARHVVAAIWELYKQNPQDQAVYNLFSLQDAIDYAKFLIRTTAEYQRFSRTTPIVGGDIDIGLVTPFDGFKWIQQKPLAKKIGGES